MRFANLVAIRNGAEITIQSISTMKKLNSAKKALVGGSCIETPGQGQEHRPFYCAAYCYASMIVWEATGGNPNFQGVCVA